MELKLDQYAMQRLITAQFFAADRLRAGRRYDYYHTAYFLALEYFNYMRTLINKTKKDANAKHEQLATYKDQLADATRLMKKSASLFGADVAESRKDAAIRSDFN